MGNKRQQVEPIYIDRAIRDLGIKLEYRLNQKGHGTFASNHEILGIIQEELTEYEAAIHTNACNEEKIKELEDIAVAALFGIASIQSGGIDW
jgi:hypothetical protein